MMHDSAFINLNVFYAAVKNRLRRIFHWSSACICPEYIQLDPDNPNCAEIPPIPPLPQ